MTRLAGVVGALVAAATLGYSGFYVALSLVRWEWERAQFFAMMFLIVEVAVVGVVLGRRRTRPGPPAAVQPSTVAVLTRARPEPREFAWLRSEPSRLSVFVPILMGAGVVLAAIAAVVERAAARMAGPSVVAGLARRLAPLAYPDGGVLGADPRPEPVDLLSGPGAGGRP